MIREAAFDAGMTKMDAKEGEPAAPAKAALDGLVQRLGALEESLTAVAGGLGTAMLPGAGQPDADAVREALLRLETRLDEIEATQRKLERQIADCAAGLAAASPPVSAELVTGEVTRQLEALIGDAAAPADPRPLLAGDDRATGDAATNPLVMGATERAIVRLTHRLEKLEEWRQRGGLIGRLFAS